MADHLSRIPNAPVEITPIKEIFSDKHILAICKEPWYANIVNYLATGQTPFDWSSHNRHHFFAQVRFFFWKKSYLYKYSPDQIIKRCIPENEHRSVLAFCPKLLYGGHFCPRKTAEIALQSGFYWPTLFKDSFNFCKLCKNCQMMGRISRRDIMPLNPILKVEIFDVWDIDFMGPFSCSFGN